MNKAEKRGSSEPHEKDVQESRRKFLEQAGKLAVYTPPAMMLMMKPSLAATVFSGCCINAEVPDVKELD